MSNPATIQRTIFKNYSTNEESYGIRVFDDYGKTYYNTMSLDTLKLGDMGLLALIHRELMYGEDDVLDDIINTGTRNGGIFIDATWYDKDELNQVLGEEPSLSEELS